MTEIAIIKWFGNSRNERHSNYKILECEDGRRLDIHASEISCSENELRRGRFITFEIEEKEAKNLRLLREVGVIDWYSDKGFGCATLIRNDLLQMFDSCQIGRSEVFVHTNQVISSCKNLTKGELVVFDIRKTYRRDKNLYRDDAINLNVLSEEIDITVALIEDGKSKNQPPNALLSELRSCLENLTQSNEAWNEIPDWILLEDKIWSLVPTNRRASILLSQLDNPSTYQNTVYKIVDLLNSSIGNERNSIIAKIPLKVKCHKNIFPLLPVTDKIEVIISHIQDAKDANEPLDTLLNELEVGLKQVEHSNVWNKIPTDILLKQQIWYLVPANRQTSVVLSQLDTSSSYENTIDLLADLLYKSSGSERTSLISRIPDKAKQHDKIFLLLPATDQVEIIVKQLREGEQENTSISSQIASIISMAPFSDRQSIISKLPGWVKEIPSIRASLFRIPSVESRPDAPEATQIRAFVDERGIFCLCHFTTIENLQGICREGGLLSSWQLQSRNSPYTQIDEGRWDGKLNHICCSINSYNSMYLYHAKHKSSCWVLLAIKPDYLWKQQTLFCPINAASKSGAYIQAGLTGLKSMYEPVVIDTKDRQYTRQGRLYRQPTCIQAEVQVYESISLDDVLLIGATPINEQKVRDAGWKGRFENFELK